MIGYKKNTQSHISSYQLLTQPCSSHKTWQIIYVFNGITLTYSWCNIKHLILARVFKRGTVSTRLEKILYAKQAKNWEKKQRWRRGDQINHLMSTKSSLHGTSVQAFSSRWPSIVISSAVLYHLYSWESQRVVWEFQRGFTSWRARYCLGRVEAKEQSRAEPKREFEENVKRRKISMFELKPGQNSEAERRLISWWWTDNRFFV